MRAQRTASANHRSLRNTGAVALTAALAVMAGVFLFAAGSRDSAAATTNGAAVLPHLHSEAELAAYLKRLHRRQPPPMPAPAMAVGSSAADAAAAPEVKSKSDNSITNNQEAGVDEGDIVKLHGDTLVILRRGRLFTVSLAGGGMRPIDSINAYPPGVNASDDWYDEMLVAGDRVIVIGYSYGRGGTEVNRFQIAANGHLAFEDAYQLRSNDYYSSRNYASRLIGHQLIFYTPRTLPYDSASALDALPALRRWTGDASRGFTRIGSAREIYLSPGVPDGRIDTVHTITSCDVAAPVLDCKATSVFGPSGRTFYVAPHAVYVWVSAYENQAPDGKPSSLLYRLPLDGGAPSAIGVRGAPVDQFSFREDAQDGVLNVLVRAESAGDAMWAPEHSQGAVALLRVGLDSFGDGTREAPRGRYRALPAPKAGGDFHNRFAGDYVLYGEGNGWGAPENAASVLVAAPVAGGAVTQLTLPHPVDRIELMGPDAVVIGSDEHNLYFSSVRLRQGTRPSLGDNYVLTGAAQGEMRSHGFFFHPDPNDADGRDGVLGLPVARPAKPAYAQLFDTSAALTFLRRAHGQFTPLGELAAHDDGAVNDACVASCVDWYGNARPIFIGGRTFALMGYELVEGKARRKAIAETGRVNFAPAHPGR